MQFLYLILVIIFIVAWYIKSRTVPNVIGRSNNREKQSIKSDLSSGTRLITLIIDRGQVVEKVYESQNGQRYTRKGNWSI